MVLFFYRSILLTFVLFRVTVSFAQCTSVPNQTDCFSGCTTLTSNVNVNSGQTYCYSGNGTLGNVNLNGGTILVCGNLELPNLNFNGGYVSVKKDAKLEFNSININNGTLVIYGEVEVKGNLTIQQSNVYVATGGRLKVDGQTTLNSNSTLVNNGRFSANYFLIQSNNSPSFCMSSASQNTVGTLYNNTTNGISGSGCIKVNTEVYLNNTLTSSAITVCMANGVSRNGSGSGGAATFQSNCTTCATPLNIDVYAFFIASNPQGLEINWSAEYDKNSSHFKLLRADSNLVFEPIRTIELQKESNAYSVIDRNDISGLVYYKLQVFDRSNVLQNEWTISHVAVKSRSFSIYPNPFNDVLKIEGNSSVSGELTLEVLSLSGTQVQTEVFHVDKGIYHLQLATSALEKGVYFVRIIQGNEQMNHYFKVTKDQ